MTPKRHRFGLFRVRSPLLAESQLFSLPAGTKMFQFPALTPSMMVTGLQPVGLPHSEMSGSKVVCTYPNLIAAYHVLLRLPEPRHPPFALAFFFYVKLFSADLNGQPQLFFNIVNLFFSLVKNLKKLAFFQPSLFLLLHCQYVKDRKHCVCAVWRITDSNR